MKQRLFSISGILIIACLVCLSCGNDLSGDMAVIGHEQAWDDAVAEYDDSPYETRVYWERQDRAMYGRLDRMLEVIRSLPPVTAYRTTRSVDELCAVLRKAGRFRQLGLSDGEGRELVKAVYEHFNLTVASRKAAGSEELVALAAGIDTRQARAEFEPLRAVLLTWPRQIPSYYKHWATMIKAMGQAGATVYLWVDSELTKRRARAYLKLHRCPTDHIQWVVEKTDSFWIRDYGPQFVYSTSGSDWGIVDFHYYEGRSLDDNVPLSFAELLSVPDANIINHQSVDTVYTEGGNLAHDSLGCVIYSKRTYSNNPDTDTSVIDSRIMSAFGASKSLVPQDPSLDGTGHVDMFMKVINETTVFVGQYNTGQTDYQVLEDCASLFQSSTNGAGQPWNVVRLPQPDVYYANFIIPVVGTYTNSLIVNNVVLLPVYGQDEDAEATAIYEEYMPGATIVPIDASRIIKWGGAWHCVTMEFPEPD